MRSALGIVLVGFAIIVASASRPAPKEPTPAFHKGIRRAVLIGVGSYLSRDIEPLAGPPHDVRSLETLLRSKYHFDDITVLVSGDPLGSEDHLPTRKRIRDAILASVEATRREDTLVVFWSGHGGEAPDINGDEGGGNDASLLPYDARTENIPDIVDDELFLWFDRLSPDARNVLLIFDACHSASLPRGRGVDLKERVVPELDARTQLYTSHADMTFNRDTPDRARVLAEKKAMDHAGHDASSPGRRILPSDARYVVLSAVSNVHRGGTDEGGSTAYEQLFDSVPRGLFSYVLWSEAERLDQGAPISLLFERVRSEVAERSFRKMQPGFSAQAGRENEPFLFTDRDVDPRLAMAAHLEIGNQWTIEVPASVPVSPLDSYVLVRRARMRDAFSSRLALVGVRDQQSVRYRWPDSTKVTGIATDPIADRTDVVAVRCNIPFEYDRPIVYVDGFPSNMAVQLVNRLVSDHPAIVFRDGRPADDEMAKFGPHPERYFRLSVDASSSRSLRFGVVGGTTSRKLLDSAIPPNASDLKPELIGDVVQKIAIASYSELHGAEVRQLLDLRGDGSFNLDARLLDSRRRVITGVRCKPGQTDDCADLNLQIDAQRGSYVAIVHVLDIASARGGPSIELWDPSATHELESSDGATVRIPSRWSAPMSIPFLVSRTGGTDSIMVVADTNPMRLLSLMEEVRALEAGQESFKKACELPRRGEPEAVRRFSRPPGAHESQLGEWVARRLSFKVE
ncbi:MAG TPA: caspase family protein [Candidatus Polarisedimenticolaceae bacterium]|nr:caspase family protein [Candidatus Polarisedimenticolaceae bacterium]